MSANESATTLQRASDGPSGRAIWRQAVLNDIRNGALPGFVVVGVLIIAGLVEIGTGGPAIWGLSRHALSEGRWLTLLSHPIAHASHWHLYMNCTALIGLTAATRPLLSRQAGSWLRYLLVLIGAAAAGAMTYLALHPSDGVPMVGASGAICGLWGLSVRCDLETYAVRSLRSRKVWTGMSSFAISNLALFAVLFLLTRAAGQAGGLAWEAHLGGFLFGLLAAPWLSLTTSSTASEPAATS